MMEGLFESRGALNEILLCLPDDCALTGRPLLQIEVVSPLDTAWTSILILTMSLQYRAEFSYDPPDR